MLVSVAYQHSQELSKTRGLPAFAGIIEDPVSGLPLKLPPRPKLRLEIPILRMMLSKHEDSQLFEDTDHELITINGLNIYCNYFV